MIAGIHTTTRTPNRGRRGCRGVVIKVEGAPQEVLKRPEGEDNDETDDAPKRELSSVLTACFISGTENEVFIDPPEEDDKRNRHQHRHKNIIDDTNDAGRVTRDGSGINAGLRE